MANGWIDTFDRVKWDNIEGKFATNIMTLGAQLPSRTQIDDLRFVSANANAPKEYHPVFAIMTKYISNYVFFDGIVQMYTHWDASRDADVAYLEANMTADEEIKQCLRYDYLSDIDFDWTNRIVTLTHDASLRPRNQWIVEDKWWCIDGLPTGYESSDSNFKGICIVAKDLYGWSTTSCHVEDGESMVFSKPETDVYIFVAKNNAVINGTPIDVDTPLHVTSSSLTIETAGEGEVVVVVKEKR
jgi:hypothetical protein